MENAYHPVTSDAIIILGHSLEDGEIPGQWLTRRLELGLSLYEQNYASVIIVSGGQGWQDELPVALSMENWLIDHGVCADQIIVEEKSRNTYENFKFTKAITDAREKPINKITVVSNDFHMFRSMYIAGHFYTDVSGAAAVVPLSLNKQLAYLKEPLSLVKVFFQLMLQHV